MKILKTIGIALLALVALWLIAAAIMPKHFEYERSTDINAPKEIVFGLVNNLTTWETWGPWKKEDPTMVNTYGAKTEGAGASYTWTGEKAGKGSMTIVESTAPSYQKTRVEFEGQGGGDAWFKIEDGESGATKTTWGFAFDVPFPFNVFAAFGSGEMNKMFDDGLAGMKELAEKIAAEQPAGGGASYAVKEMNFPGRTYVGIRERATFEQTMSSSFFGDRFGKISGLLSKAKFEMAGPPSGVYYEWDESNKTTDMAVAVPVKANTAVSGGGIKAFEIPAGKALVIDYYGSYQEVGKAHTAMDEYIKTKGLTQKPPVIEEYITDPMTEPDTAKWLTKVYYFVEGQ